MNKNVLQFKFDKIQLDYGYGLIRFASVSVDENKEEIEQK